MSIQRFIFCFLLCVCIWLCGLIWFVSQIPTAPTADKTTTDAIIALTGGGSRVEYSLRLMAEGRGKKLFISGVHDNTLPEIMQRRATGELRARLEALPQGTIVLGHEAENTIGNAEESARWVKKENVHSIRLVTANYHMPRSLEEFHRQLPDTIIIPDPVFPDDFKLSNWWEHNESRLLILLEYHKLVASKLRHWFVSVTHGKA